MPRYIVLMLAAVASRPALRICCRAILVSITTSPSSSGFHDLTRTVQSQLPQGPRSFPAARGQCGRH
jgi:hypothetical protein